MLGVLGALMGFASISTDLYLPAMPAMGRELGARPGAVELTISGYQSASVSGNSCGVRSAIATDGAGRSPSG